MKTQFEIKKGCNPCGTFLHGYLTANYKDIVRLLGKDGESDGYKVDAEWNFTINGKDMTLYNYKTGKNYLGRAGKAKSKITHWHIGASTDITSEANFLAEKLNATFEPTR